MPYARLYSIRPSRITDSAQPAEPGFWNFWKMPSTAGFDGGVSLQQASSIASRARTSFRIGASEYRNCIASVMGLSLRAMTTIAIVSLVAWLWLIRERSWFWWPHVMPKHDLTPRANVVAIVPARD